MNVRNQSIIIANDGKIRQDAKNHAGGAEEEGERETAKASSRTKTTPKSIAPKTSQNPPPRTPTAVSAGEITEEPNKPYVLERTKLA